MVRCQEVGGNALTVCMLSGPRASSILVKGSANPLSFYTTRDTGLISGSGRFPGVGNGNSLQYSCLGSPMDRGAWWATVCGFAKNWIWLNARACTHTHTPHTLFPRYPVDGHLRCFQSFTTTRTTLKWTSWHLNL